MNPEKLSFPLIISNNINQGSGGVDIYSTISSSRSNQIESRSKRKAQLPSFLYRKQEDQQQQQVQPLFDIQMRSAQLSPAPLSQTTDQTRRRSKEEQNQAQNSVQQTIMKMNKQQQQALFDYQLQKQQQQQQKQLQQIIPNSLQLKNNNDFTFSSNRELELIKRKNLDVYNVEIYTKQRQSAIHDNRSNNDESTGSNGGGFGGSYSARSNQAGSRLTRNTDNQQYYLNYEQSDSHKYSSINAIKYYYQQQQQQTQLRQLDYYQAPFNCDNLNIICKKLEKESFLVFDSFLNMKPFIRDTAGPEQRKRLFEFVKRNVNNLAKSTAFQSEQINTKQYCGCRILSEAEKEEEMKLVLELNDKERMNFLLNKNLPPYKYYPPTGDLKVDLEETSLLFESRFESGNLRKAYKVSDSEYNLVLDFDSMSEHQTQWYFFRVSNIKKNMTVKFNIINFYKENSLYENGLKPVVFSERHYLSTQQGWHSDCMDISYTKNEIKKLEQTRPGAYQQQNQQSMSGSKRNSEYGYEHKKKQRGKYTNSSNTTAQSGFQSEAQQQQNLQQPFYTLSFTYTFNYANDLVYFAHCYPYTYTDLSQYMAKLRKQEKQNQHFTVGTLGRTVIGNSIYCLTITNNIYQQTQPPLKKCICLTGRVHPGESNSSWVMKGIIDFLVSNDMRAVKLRDQYIFKIIPMLNPDGVRYGNYRFCIFGNDLNRKWKRPNSLTQRPIYLAKQLIKDMLSEREVFFVCDIHGHSKNQNVFIYGCQEKEEAALNLISNINNSSIVVNSLSVIGTNQGVNSSQLIMTTQSAGIYQGYNSNGQILAGYGPSGGCGGSGGSCGLSSLSEKNVQAKIFPFLFSQRKEYFDFNKCAFALQKKKSGTARIVCWNEYNIVRSYTLECSFMGFSINGSGGVGGQNIGCNSPLCNSNGSRNCSPNKTRLNPINESSIKEVELFQSFEDIGKEFLNTLFLINDEQMLRHAISIICHNSKLQQQQQLPHSQNQQQQQQQDQNIWEEDEEVEEEDVEEEETADSQQKKQVQEQPYSDQHIKEAEQKTEENQQKPQINDEGNQSLSMKDVIAHYESLYLQKGQQTLISNKDILFNGNSSFPIQTKQLEQDDPNTRNLDNSWQQQQQQSHASKNACTTTARDNCPEQSSSKVFCKTKMESSVHQVNEEGKNEMFIQLEHGRASSSKKQVWLKKQNSSETHNENGNDNSSGGGRVQGHETMKAMLDNITHQLLPQNKCSEKFFQPAKANWNVFAFNSNEKNHYFFQPKFQSPPSTGTCFDSKDGAAIKVLPMHSLKAVAMQKQKHQQQNYQAQQQINLYEKNYIIQKQQLPQLQRLQQQQQQQIFQTSSTSAGGNGGGDVGNCNCNGNSIFQKLNDKEHNLMNIYLKSEPNNNQSKLKKNVLNPGSIRSTKNANINITAAAANTTTGDDYNSTSNNCESEETNNYYTNGNGHGNSSATNNQTQADLQQTLSIRKVVKIIRTPIVTVGNQGKRPEEQQESQQQIQHGGITTQIQAKRTMFSHMKEMEEKLKDMSSNLIIMGSSPPN